MPNHSIHRSWLACRLMKKRRSPEQIVAKLRQAELTGAVGAGRGRDAASIRPCARGMNGVGGESALMQSGDPPIG